MDQPIVYIFPNASMDGTIETNFRLANWPYTTHYVPWEAQWSHG